MKTSRLILAIAVVLAAALGTNQLSGNNKTFSAKDSLTVNATIVDGDTLPMVNLPEVIIVSN